MLQCVGLELKKFHSAFATTMPPLFNFKVSKPSQSISLSAQVPHLPSAEQKHYKSIIITSDDAPTGDDDGVSLILVMIILMMTIIVIIITLMLLMLMAMMLMTMSLLLPMKMPINCNHAWQMRVLKLAQSWTTMKVLLSIPL